MQHTQIALNELYGQFLEENRNFLNALSQKKKAELPEIYNRMMDIRDRMKVLKASLESSAVEQQQLVRN